MTDCNLNQINKGSFYYPSTFCSTSGRTQECPC